MILSRFVPYSFIPEQTTDKWSLPLEENTKALQIAVGQSVINGDEDIKVQETIFRKGRWMSIAKKRHILYPFVRIFVIIAILTSIYWRTAGWWIYQLLIEMELARKKYIIEPLETLYVGEGNTVFFKSTTNGAIIGWKSINIATSKRCPEFSMGWAWWWYSWTAIANEKGRSESPQLGVQTLIMIYWKRLVWNIQNIFVPSKMQDKLDSRI